MISFFQIDTERTVNGSNYWREVEREKGDNGCLCKHARCVVQAVVMSACRARQKRALIHLPHATQPVVAFAFMMARLLERDNAKRELEGGREAS